MPSVLVTHPAHFVRGPDGHVYAPETLLAHDFWTRYLAVFDSVCVAARVRQVDNVGQQAARADGPGVVFCELPDYTGPWQYLRCRGEMKSRLGEAAPRYQAYCLRVPCPVATLVWRELLSSGRPFAVEVGADPWDSLSAGAIRSIARPLARRLARRNLRAQCRTAAASAYVTRQVLQRRYPPAPDAFTTHYSTIQLPKEALVTNPRTDFTGAQRLIFVGTLAVLYKAPDVLVRALARAGRKGLHLTVVGDGRAQPELEALAASCGVAGQISFVGRLPAGEPVRAALDAADLFVLPSRQEGLPRAMIEAMARSLPCIGSVVGGIPELLEPEDMVPPGDPDALARKILEFVGDPQRMRRSAQRNLERARDYLADTLAAQRTRFYETLRRISCPTGAAARRPVIGRNPDRPASA